MKIRRATLSDLDAVVAVKVMAIRPIYEPRGSDALASDYDEDEQHAWLRHLLSGNDERSVFLVAVDDIDRVVGWIRIGRVGAFAEINGLFVDPCHQGCGVGKELMREGCRHMTNLGCTSAKVQTLAGSPACAFYQRLGGRHDGDVPFRGEFIESVFQWDNIGLVAPE